MKKLILSTAMLISVACLGQNSSLNYAKIMNTPNDTVYLGDSSYVDIFYYYAVPQGFTANVNIQVSASLDPVDSFTFRHLDSVQHVQVFNNNTGNYVDCARVPFIVPFGAALGQSFYYCNNETFPIFVAQHLTTDLFSSALFKQIKEIKYYNLIGQEIYDLKGVIIQRTLYSDGSIKTQKQFK